MSYTFPAYYLPFDYDCSCLPKFSLCSCLILNFSLVSSEFCPIAGEAFLALIYKITFPCVLYVLYILLFILKYLVHLELDLTSFGKYIFN